MQDIFAKQILQNGNRPENVGSQNDLVFILIILLIILIIALFCVIIYLIIRYYKNSPQTEQFSTNTAEKITIPESLEKIITSTSDILSLEEKLIIKILLEHQGNILQKNLPKLSNYSKSTITRIMSRLEDNDVTYRVPAGRGYRVFLKDFEREN